MSKILIIGDIHLRERLGYADYIPDGRVAEKKEILDFITSEANDCEGVVLLGDNFHFKNNPSEVVREFVAFVESFGDKEVYILAGNHEKFGDGKSAIDFLREVKKANWHIITDKIEKFGDMVFCPYFFKGEMGSTNSKTATQKLVKKLPPGKVLFAHHAISDITFNGMSTNDLPEIVLPRKALEKEYELTVIGHIHKPMYTAKVLVAGSIINNEVGESGRKINKLTFNQNGGIGVKEIDLPGRPIIKLEDPKKADLEAKDLKGAIVKVIYTKKTTREAITEAKTILSKSCDAYIIVEKAQNSAREKAKLDSIMNLGVEDLLKLYAKEKKIDANKLIKGYQLL